MKIASFNINSVRARINNLIEWLNTEQPDVVLLQELKCQDDQFPYMEIESAGYKAEVFGQKAYNGVAIISKHEMNDVLKGLPFDETDEQSRYIEATINGIRVCNLYLPNGNPLGTEKYDYKLKWMDRLGKHIKTNLLTMDKPVVIGGDYNVIPMDDDCVNPADWTNDAAATDATRARFNAFQNLGLYEVFKTLHPNKTHEFTFWDYQRGAWDKNNGIRIDFFLANGSCMDMITDCWVDKNPRSEEKSSDHTPLVISLNN
ncbi:MAG: exodeoxyribonuclease III [Alphaproteobacteria bacterium]